MVSRGLLQEGKLELVELKRIHLIHNEVSDQTFVTPEDVGGQCVHFLEVLDEPTVQESRLSFQRDAIVPVAGDHFVGGSRRRGSSYPRRLLLGPLSLKLLQGHRREATLARPRLRNWAREG